MGILSRNQGENHNNIASVVLIEQTQKYKNKTSWGLSFSNSPFGDPIAMSQTVPDGTELTFSITYKNGRKKILKVMSDTAMAVKSKFVCKLLLGTCGARGCSASLS
jgi:hypothetical protein